MKNDGVAESSTCVVPVATTAIEQGPFANIQATTGPDITMDFEQPCWYCGQFFCTDMMTGGFKDSTGSLRIGLAARMPPLCCKDSP